MSKKNESKRPPKKKSVKGSPESGAKAKAKEVSPAAPAQRGTAVPVDTRLPAPGALLQKRDRHGSVRCECMVESDGIRYSGKVYKSLSAAAVAAAKDLGLTNKTQNGFIFWGLSRPPRRSGDLLVGLGRAWERYFRIVEALLKEGVTDENRANVLTTLKNHAQSIETLREKVA